MAVTKGIVGHGVPKKVPAIGATRRKGGKTIIAGSDVHHLLTAMKIGNALTNVTPKTTQDRCK